MKRLTLWLVALGLGALSVDGAAAQHNSRPGEPKASLDEAAWAQVLDTIFPRGPFDNGSFSFVLRRGADAQFVVHLESEGTVNARWYRIRDAEPFAVARRYVERTGDRDIKRIARRIRVEERTLNVTRSAAEKWQSEFLKVLTESMAALERLAEQFCREGSDRIVLHGTQYDVWYTQGLVSVHWSFAERKLFFGRTKK